MASAHLRLFLIGCAHVSRLKTEIATMPYQAITLDFANGISSPIGCLYMQPMVIS